MSTGIGSISNKVTAILATILLVGAGIAGTYYWQQRTINNLETDVSNLKTELANNDQRPDAAQASVTNYESDKGVGIVLYAPRSGETVTAPLVVMGEVPGDWSFEASFPVRLLNAQNEVVAEGTAQVLGDWMTDELVPFRAVLNYSSDQSGNGTLVLQKDNPSDLAENADSLTVPVTF